VIGSRIWAIQEDSVRSFSLLFLTLASLAGAQFERLPDTTVTYARIDSVELKLDLYQARPRGESRPGGARPVILWIHGGGWRGGDRTEESPAFEWIDSGFTVASVDYRLSPVAMSPAQVHDVKAAVRWLRANASAFSLDTSRIIAWGASAGGHLAAMLGVTAHADGFDGVVGDYVHVDSRVRAVVDYYGAMNFMEYVPNRWTSWSSVGQLLGCAVPKCPDRARWSSPLEYVTPDDVPFFIVHGIADTVVPVSQSAMMNAALVGAGVPVEFHTVAEGHGGRSFTADSTKTWLSGFFARTLYPAVPADSAANP
jgi:acetyl esterase/lipase